MEDKVAHRPGIVSEAVLCQPNNQSNKALSEAAVSFIGDCWCWSSRNKNGRFLLFTGHVINAVQYSVLYGVDMMYLVSK